MDAALVVFKKNGKRLDIPLKAGVTIMGRRPDCDVRIPLGTVSRKHCRIVQKDEGFVLQDLGSANGTYLNSQRIIEDVVNAGDTISVGSFHFTVQIEGKPENIQPPAKKQDTSELKSTHGSTVGDFAADTGDAAKLIEEEDHPDEIDTLAQLEPLADYDELEGSSVA